MESFAVLGMVVLLLIWAIGTVIYHLFSRGHTHKGTNYAQQNVRFWSSNPNNPNNLSSIQNPNNPASWQWRHRHHHHKH